MATPGPHIVILAGPNGAGKTTAAPALLRGALQVGQFVNADVIARGLSGFRPEEVALLAARIMLERINALADAGETFAFETTLASRSLVPWIADRLRGGYSVRLVFLWLVNEQIAIARVADRVRRGGHGVPAAVVSRRYCLGLRNFFDLYQPLVTSWRMYDNSKAERPRLIARGHGQRVTSLHDPLQWHQIQESTRHGQGDG